MPREKYWGPDPKRLERVKQKIDECGAKRILDVGPGKVPLQWATDTAGSVHYRGQTMKETPGVEFRECDFLNERLPYDDNEIDFVYCRHVIEDLYNPEPLLKEMSRVGKAGYVECPSPAAELCPGIDAGEAKYRGYMHHLWIVWPHHGTLYLTTKYTLAQTIQVDSFLIGSLLCSQRQWNVGMFWKGQLPYHISIHERDYMMQRDYSQLLKFAIEQGSAN